MKDKFLGHTVKIRLLKKRPDPWAGHRGKVVCVVRNKRIKHYIVQFQDDWCYFRSKTLKIDE